VGDSLAAYPTACTVATGGWEDTVRLCVLSLLTMEDEIKTIDNLARLIKRTMASKEDVQGVQVEVAGLREEMNETFEGVASQFQGINSRLGGVLI
jgi:hypothetical protein